MNTALTRSSLRTWNSSDEKRREGSPFLRRRLRASARMCVPLEGVDTSTFLNAGARARKPVAALDDCPPTIVSRFPFLRRAACVSICYTRVERPRGSDQSTSVITDFSLAFSPTCVFLPLLFTPKKMSLSILFFF